VLQVSAEQMKELASKQETTNPWYWGVRTLIKVSPLYSHAPWVLRTPEKFSHLVESAMHGALASHVCPLAAAQAHGCIRALQASADNSRMLSLPHLLAGICSCERQVNKMPDTSLSRNFAHRCILLARSIVIPTGLAAMSWRTSVLSDVAANLWKKSARSTV